MKNNIASIEIYNNKLYVMPVLGFLDSVAVNHRNLDIDRYQRMRLVAGELLMQRIKTAYPGERGKLYVDLTLTSEYFEFSVRDMGVPVWHDFSYNKENIAEGGKDLRNFVIDNIADNIGMEKLGQNGQRVYVRMIVKNPIEFKKPEPYPETEAHDTNITIRPVATEEDAIEAIRCIYSEYGYSYSYERLYYVDSFMELVKRGELLSFLAVNDHGQTAGHFALAFSDTYKNMPEISTVVIRKEFRGLGLFSLFMNYCEKYAKENNVRALMGQPVAFHPMSQKAFLKAEYTATAMLMSYLDAELESEYNKETERLSLCASVKIIDEEASSLIYPPKELKGFIAKIYDRLGWKYEMCAPGEAEEISGISIAHNDRMKMTKIVLTEAGKDAEDILRETTREVIRRKNEMTELLILLNSQGCEHAYIAAKNCGFTVSGILPGGENGDYLIMQMLPADDMNYDKLVTVGEFEELKEDIRKLNVKEAE